MRETITGKEILTREEVMEVLKIGRSTFYKLLQTCDSKRETGIKFLLIRLKSIFVGECIQMLNVCILT